MTRYTALADAINSELADTFGDYAHCYDIEAIAAEAFEYRVDTNDRGQELLDTAGFELIVTGDEFWEIAARHEL